MLYRELSLFIGIVKYSFACSNLSLPFRLLPLAYNQLASSGQAKDLDLYCVWAVQVSPQSTVF